ncbi:alpha/beta hydrolase [Paenibacillus sp. FSL L8-0340]|uniref:alpha/beta hydrolase n=1 Tax=Paenibacillus sp. FSL L8-0340 TaxID=2954685 RepID=UPI0031586134
MMNKWSTRDFPVGLYDLHPNVSINFQMNRFYNWTNDEDMLREMREAARSIHSYEELVHSFIQLGNQALEQDKKLKAAYYFRGGEFYLPEGNPKKQQLRKQFIALTTAHYGIAKEQHHLIPYENKFLSAYHISADNPKRTVVFFGGFDSYVEELLLMVMIFKGAGFDVVCFDGPGQGAALEDYGLPFTHEWERPVSAVLDFFSLDNVTLIGMSLGGFLAVRAAAFEKRVKHVIAYDVLTNFFEVFMHQVEPETREKLQTLLADGQNEQVNTALQQMAGKSLMIEWGLMQGMHITSSQTPAEFMRKTMLYNTKDISSLLTQDVLLLAGQEDHYVPLKQLNEQITSLTHVRSLTARMFTAKEHASNHCQIGNLGLAADVMLQWIGQF